MITGSDHRCDCKESGDNTLSGAGEGARWGQIINVTAKGAGMMYFLEVEKEHIGVRSETELQREWGRRMA
jgi:hypothetical protein